MYNDSQYNPELDPGKFPELAGENIDENSSGIAPGWEDVAAEADSENAPPLPGSPESYHSPENFRQGTIGEDLDALRGHIDNVGNEDIDELDQLTDPDSAGEDPENNLIDNSSNKSPNNSTEEPDEAEVEARLREYVMELESEFNSVRGMSNDGLRRQIRDERRSLEQELSAPDAANDREKKIDLAVRKRAEVIFRERDSEQA